MSLVIESLKLKIANWVLAIKLKALPCVSCWYWKHIYFIKENMDILLDAKVGHTAHFRELHFHTKVFSKTRKSCTKHSIVSCELLQCAQKLQIQCLKRHTTERTIKQENRCLTLERKVCFLSFIKIKFKSHFWVSVCYLFYSLLCIYTYLHILSNFCLLSV